MLPGETPSPVKAKTNSATSPTATDVAPGVVMSRLKTPGLVLPPTKGSAWPGEAATVRCTRLTGHWLVPVFFSCTVNRPVLTPGVWTRDGALERATSAALYAGLTCHQLDRRPSEDPGQEWA